MDKDTVLEILEAISYELSELEKREDEALVDYDMDDECRVANYYEIVGSIYALKNLEEKLTTLMQ